VDTVVATEIAYWLELLVFIEIHGVKWIEVGRMARKLYCSRKNKRSERPALEIRE
jgi:hypothetical protein